MNMKLTLSFGAGLCIMAWFAVAAQIGLHFGISPIYAFVAGVVVSTITIILLYRYWRIK